MTKIPKNLKNSILNYSLAKMVVYNYFSKKNKKNSFCINLCKA
jgi:hypothetical protein